MQSLEEEYRLKLEEQAEYEKKQAVFDSKVETVRDTIIKNITTMSSEEKSLLLEIEPGFNIDSEKMSDLAYIREVCGKFAIIKEKLEEKGRALLKESEDVQLKHNLR